MPVSIVIVGGGLMGLSAAFHLRRADAGVRVTVLERRRWAPRRPGERGRRARHGSRSCRARAGAGEPGALGRARSRAGGRHRLSPRRGPARGAGRESLEPAPAGWPSSGADDVPLEVLSAADVRRLAPGMAPGTLGGALLRASTDRPARWRPRRPSRAPHAASALTWTKARRSRRSWSSADRVTAVTRADGRREPCDVAIVAAGAWTPDAAAGHRRPASPSRTRPLQMLLTEPAP